MLERWVWTEEQQHEPEAGEDLYILRAERRLLWPGQQAGGVYNKRLRDKPCVFLNN